MKDIKHAKYFLIELGYLKNFPSKAADETANRNFR